MRLLLASISMMTVLAGITLPHTTTFNVWSPVNEFADYKYDKGAFEIKAPLVAKLISLS
jgi:hypothetical protein